MAETRYCIAFDFPHHFFCSCMHQSDASDWFSVTSGNEVLFCSSPKSTLMNTNS